MTDKPDQGDPIAKTLSLAKGGLYDEYSRRLGFAGPRQTIKQVALWLVICWLPLAALSLVKGTAWGHRVEISLLQDFSIYGRFFVALPLLIIADSVIDRFTHRATAIFDSSGIIKDSDLALYHLFLEKTAKLRDSRIADLFLLVLSFIPFFLFLASSEWSSNRTPTWHGSKIGGLTPAGWWFVFVSSPVLRFLMLRWVWRYALWTHLLSKISRFNLNLLPMHPDRVGGLGFLSFAQQQFGLLAAALASVVAGQYANEIAYLGQPLKEIKAEAGLFIGGSIIITLLPLTFFSFRLFEARYDTLVRNNHVARIVTSTFDEKWARKKDRTPALMIGSQDPSSLIDYISSFESMRGTRVIPVNRRSVVYVAALAGIPFASLWLLTTPVETWVTEILKRLI